MKILSSTELSGLLEVDIDDLFINGDIMVTYYGTPKINITRKVINNCVKISLHDFCRFTHYRLKELLKNKKAFEVVSYNGSNGFDKKAKTVFYGTLI